MDVEDQESPLEVVSDRCGLLSVLLDTDEDSDGEWQALLLPCCTTSSIHNYTYNRLFLTSF